MKVTHEDETHAPVLLEDIEGCIRLIKGQSLPIDMEQWRAGLVARLECVLSGRQA